LSSSAAQARALFVMTAAIAALKCARSIDDLGPAQSYDRQSEDRDERDRKLDQTKRRGVRRRLHFLFDAPRARARDVVRRFARTMPLRAVSRGACALAR
jgi:hypothetical protein